MKGLQLRAGHFFAAAAVVALLAPSFAVAQVPAGATAVCGDGSYSNTPTKRGACSGHKGIKTWLADQKPAPAARAAKAAPRATPKPAPAAAAAARPAGATGVCGDGTYTSAKSVRGACSGHGGVKTWLTPPAGVPAAAPMRAPAPAAAAPMRPRAPAAAAPAARPAVPAARNAPPRAMPATAPSPKAAPPAKANAAVNAANATALCNDGAYSASQHRRGACAGHGGVKQWLKEVAK